MNKAKKLLALVLAVVMCASLFSTLAFAAPGDIDADDVERPKTAYNIVCIGDESANGYGLAGYGNSKSGEITNNPDVGALDCCAPDAYVARLGNAIQYVLGQGFDVKTTNLCFNGMRTEELASMLEGVEGDSYNELMMPKYELWFNYNKESLNNGRMPEDDWNKLSPLQKLANKDEAPYVDLQDYVVDVIDKASLITLDLGLNNYSTYILNRLECALEWYAKYLQGEEDYYYEYTDENGDTKREIDWTGYPYLNEDAEAIHGELVLGSEDMLRLLVDGFLNELAGVAPDSLIDEIADTFLYATLDYCVSFTKDIAYLRFINPLAQIIVLGSYNALDGMKLTVPYKNQVNQNPDKVKVIELDIGDLWAGLFGFAESYVCNSEASSQFKYASLLNTDVETIFDEYCESGLSPEMEKMIKTELAGLLGQIVAGVVDKAIDTAVESLTGDLVEAGVMTEEDAEQIAEVATEVLDAIPVDFTDPDSVVAYVDGAAAKVEAMQNDPDKAAIVAQGDNILDGITDMLKEVPGEGATDDEVAAFKAKAMELVAGLKTGLETPATKDFTVEAIDYAVSKAITELLGDIDINAILSGEGDFNLPALLGDDSPAQPLDVNLLLANFVANIDRSHNVVKQTVNGKEVVVYDPQVVSSESIMNIGDITKAFVGDVSKEKDYGTMTILALYTRLLVGTNALNVLSGVIGDAVGLELNADEDAVLLAAPVATMPSKDGHTAKLNAILKTWVMPGNASTEGEDVTIGAFDNFFQGLTGTFKVPLLDVINGAFQKFAVNIYDFFANFFGAIRNGISGIFGRN